MKIRDVRNTIPMLNQTWLVLLNVLTIVFIINIIKVLSFADSQAHCVNITYEFHNCFVKVIKNLKTKTIFLFIQKNHSLQGYSLYTSFN